MRTSARITSIDAASAGKSTASFPACTTSATPFKSLLCRQTHDLPTGIHPSQLGLRSNHRPPDGGRPARSRQLCFFLGAFGERVSEHAPPQCSFFVSFNSYFNSGKPGPQAATHALDRPLSRL